jgi:hypothetical protein
VLVVAHFPETAAARVAKSEGGALLENANKFEQITVIVDAFSEHVQMVWHETKRVQAKRMPACQLVQQIENRSGGPWYSEVWRAAVTANSDEIGLAAQVVFG